MGSTSDREASLVRPDNGSRQGAAGGFHSLLFEDQVAADQGAAQPSWFHDLGLDQIVATLVTGRESYDLALLFHLPLTSPAAVLYRQGVVRDLDRPETVAACAAFARAMRAVREAFARADGRIFEFQRHRILLTGVTAYCAGVSAFAEALDRCPIASHALIGLRAFLADTIAGSDFVETDREARALATGFAAIRYDLRVYGGGFRVERHADGRDYGAEVEALFGKFRQDAGARRPSEPTERSGLSQIEERILDFVARLNPDLFSRLAAIAARARDILLPTVGRVDRELQFFLAYADLVAPLRQAGLPFCLPTVTTDKAVTSRDGFDVLLATKLVREGRPVVTNSFRLDGDDRIVLVSGPNQGGKTTFARAFGQMHHLASLGLPVPGREATLHLFDAIHTHFEREERVTDRRGKLEDELVRIRAILDVATPRSIIVLNEIFSSTTLEDAVFLAGEVVRRIVTLDALCVIVTFLDELVAVSPTIVSFVGEVVTKFPSRRTFRIVRRPADGRSYALSIAEKYRLDAVALNARLRF